MLMTNFNYNGSVIRTIIDDEDNVWFAGVDVCNQLDYSNSYQTCMKLDEDERKLDSITDSQGKQKETLTINEYGLYSLILSSSKPEAKAFKRWITHEVLPSIRKSGKYSTDEAQEREDSIQALVAVIERIENEIGDLKFAVSEKKKLQEQKEAELRQLLKTDYRQYKLQFPKNED